MRSLAHQWTSARRGVAKMLACVITTGLIALFAPGCGDGAPTPKPGEPGGGPKAEDAAGIKDVTKKNLKADDDSISEKRAKRKAAAGN